MYVRPARSLVCCVCVKVTQPSPGGTFPPLNSNFAWQGTSVYSLYCKSELQSKRERAHRAHIKRVDGYDHGTVDPPIGAQNTSGHSTSPCHSPRRRPSVSRKKGMDDAKKNPLPSGEMIESY